MKTIKTAKELGILVRRARKTQGLSQDDLSGLSGTGRRFIGDLEKGKETVQLGKAIHILGVLGISLNAIQKWKVSEE